MDAISDFVNTITAYEINIPLSLQIAIIVVIIILLCIGGYFMREVFEVESMRSGFSWFIFVAILNLLTLLVIFLYYNSKEGSYKGQKGKKGKKGKLGKKGTSVSCNLCKNNLYLQTAKQSDTLCRIFTDPPEFKSIFDNKKYFDDIINKGNSIKYDSFIKSIILDETSDDSNKEAIANFKSLMNTNSIAVLLIKAINELTKSDDLIYGSIRRPSVLQKYVPIGDSVYGGTEELITLNSFMIAGNILYPQKYDKLVQFTAFNGASDVEEQYIIWRPVGQTTTEQDYKNTSKSVKYSPLGDICRNIANPPQINETPTISEKCLERVKLKDIQLIFIYVGAVKVNGENAGIQNDSYLIEHAPVNDIEVFSVWRTPLNTFLTNCNSMNTIVNNTVIYNIYNINENTDTDTDSPNENNNATGDNTGVGGDNNEGNEDDADNEDDSDNILTSYKSISISAKNKFTTILSSIQIPKIITALILCKYYESELMKDLVYYINYYKSSVPEFANVNTISSSFGDLMKLISNTKKKYNNYNLGLLDQEPEPTYKQATVEKKNIGLMGTGSNYSSDGPLPTEYNPDHEKHLPKMILNIYDTINTKLLTISVQITNTNSLLDILNLVFENGIETRIAINSDGIAQGGVFMNSIQELIIRVCKMLIPPNVPVYTIKDECLGTFALDRERANVIIEFTDAYDVFIKLSQDIGQVCLSEVENDSDYDCVMLLKNAENYITNIMHFKFGQLCGYIEDYLTKINTGNLEEFTTNRIKGLIEIINDGNIYLRNLIESAK